MTRKTSSTGQQHMERRARGLSRELDRMLWERLGKTIAEVAGPRGRTGAVDPAR